MVLERKERTAERLNREFWRGEFWSNSRLPSFHRGKLAEAMTWPNGAAETALATVEGGGMLALIGTRGTGKTQLSAMLARHFIESLGKSAIYWRADEYFDWVKGLFGKDDAERKRSEMYQHGLFILDEIQDRGDTEFEDRELRRLIDKRYGAHRPTVLIGNLDAKQFAERVGNSIVSRITEVGTVIVCDWPSFRTPKGAA